MLIANQLEERWVRWYAIEYCNFVHVDV